MKRTRMLVFWVCLTFVLGRSEGENITSPVITTNTSIPETTQQPGSWTTTTPQPGNSTTTTQQPGNSTSVTSRSSTSDAASSHATANGTSPQQSTGTASSSSSTSSTSTTTTSKGERVASFRGQALIPAISILIYSSHR